MGKKVVECAVGYYEIDDRGVKEYYGGLTEEGRCFKDIEAWERGEGVIYIGDCELEDMRNGVDESELWTRDSWVQWLRVFLENTERGYMCEEGDFIEGLAYDILINASWCDLVTVLIGWDECYNLEFSWESYKKDRGII